ncbi:hypothetical protein C8R45DRAFT_1014883, partial [Mycena sanguinolenta]
IFLCVMKLALNLFFKLWPPVVACKTAGGPNLRTVSLSSSLPLICVDQTSVDNVPCRYRAPFGAHRGGSDSLALTSRAFFFYLPTYLISLFFSLSRFLPFGVLTLSSL